MGFFIYPFSFIFFVVKFWSEERIYLVIEEQKQNISSLAHKNKIKQKESDELQYLMIAVKSTGN
jgi:hypothetical protein